MKIFLDRITKTENVLKVSRIRRLTLHRKIKAFKTLASSKIVFLSLKPKVCPESISELERIKNIFCGLLNQK